MNTFHDPFAHTLGDEPHTDAILDLVLGELDENQTHALKQHISQCEICRAEYEPLARGYGALAISPQMIPSSGTDRLWERIAAEINQTAATDSHAAAQISETSPHNMEAYRSNTRYYLATAALIVLALLGGFALGRYVAPQKEAIPETITLQFSEGDQEIEATLRYLPEDQVFVLETANMPPPPEGKVYQVWMIQNDTPQAAGVMNPSTGTYATSADRDDYQALAITIEDGPLGSDAPTTDPILTADLSSD